MWSNIFSLLHAKKLQLTLEFFPNFPKSMEVSSSSLLHRKEGLISFPALVYVVWQTFLSFPFLRYKRSSVSWTPYRQVETQLWWVNWSQFSLLPEYSLTFAEFKVFLLKALCSSWAPAVPTNWTLGAVKAHSNLLPLTQLSEIWWVKVELLGKIQRLGQASLCHSSMRCTDLCLLSLLLM